MSLTQTDVFFAANVSISVLTIREELLASEDRLLRAMEARLLTLVVGGTAGAANTAGALGAGEGKVRAMGLARCTRWGLGGEGTG